MEQPDIGTEGRVEGPPLASVHPAEQGGSQRLRRSLALEILARRIYFSRFAWKLLKHLEKVSLSTMLASKLGFVSHDGDSSGPTGRAPRRWKKSSAGATHSLMEGLQPYFEARNCVGCPTLCSLQEPSPSRRRGARISYQVLLQVSTRFQRPRGQKQLPHHLLNMSIPPRHPTFDPIITKRCCLSTQASVGARSPLSPHPRGPQSSSTSLLPGYEHQEGHQPLGHISSGLHHPSLGNPVPTDNKHSDTTISKLNFSRICWGLLMMHSVVISTFVPGCTIERSFIL